VEQRAGIAQAQGMGHARDLGEARGPAPTVLIARVGVTPYGRPRTIVAARISPGCGPTGDGPQGFGQNYGFAH
ncbi:MAG: hypothetical protein WBH86_16700, partial [Thermogutta sp.]